MCLPASYVTIDETWTTTCICIVTTSLRTMAPTLTSWWRMACATLIIAPTAHTSTLQFSILNSSQFMDIEVYMTAAKFTMVMAQNLIPLLPPLLAFDNIKICTLNKRSPIHVRIVRI